jgi:hypothetical protein
MEKVKCGVSTRKNFSHDTFYYISQFLSQDVDITT